MIAIAAALVCASQSGGSWQPFHPNSGVVGVRLSAAQKAPLYRAADRLLPGLRQLLPPDRGFDLVPQRNIWSTKDPDSGVPSIGMSVQMFTGPLSGEANSIQVYTNTLRFFAGQMVYNGTKNGVRVFRMPPRLPFSGVLPALNAGYGRAMVLITPPGREPFKPVSRRRALECARRLIRKKAEDPNASVAALYRQMLQQLEADAAAMSEADLSQPAFIGVGEMLTGWRGFADETRPGRRGAVPLVEVREDFFPKAMKGTSFRSLLVVLPIREPSTGSTKGTEIAHCIRQIETFDWSRFHACLE